MFRIIISGLVAGIVFFIWGALVWTVLHFHSEIRMLPDEDAGMASIREAAPDRGAYFFPHPHRDHQPGMTAEERKASEEAFMQRHNAGPVGMLFIHPNGLDVNQAVVMGRGLLLFIAVGLVASLMLALAAGPLSGYAGRFVFVLGFGAVVVLFIDLTMWNWMHMPTDYSLRMAADHMIGWALAGLAMAGIVKPLKVKPT